MIQKEAHTPKNAYSKSAKTDLKLQAKVVRLKEENKNLKRDVKNLQARLDAKHVQISKLEEQILTYLQKLLNPQLLIKEKKQGKSSEKPLN